MELGHLWKMMSNGTFAGEERAHRNLPRYAAMAGVEINPDETNYEMSISGQEIPMEAVKQILALDFAERATADLRAMGEAAGNIQIPSNINVWQHLKGESAMREAAASLTTAARLLVEKIQE